MRIIAIAGWVPAVVATGIWVGSCGPQQQQQLELEPELEAWRVGAEVAACRSLRRAAGKPAEPACLECEGTGVQERSSGVEMDKSWCHGGVGCDHT